MTLIQALNVKLNTFGDLALHLILAVQKLVQLLMSTTGTMKNNLYNLRIERDEQESTTTLATKKKRAYVRIKQVKSDSYLSYGQSCKTWNYA